MNFFFFKNVVFITFNKLINNLKSDEKQHFWRRKKYCLGLKKMIEFWEMFLVTINAFWFLHFCNKTFNYDMHEGYNQTWENSRLRDQMSWKLICKLWKIVKKSRVFLCVQKSVHKNIEKWKQFIWYSFIINLFSIFIIFKVFFSN